MSESGTKVPVSSDGQEHSSAPAEWRPFENVRRDIDHLIDDLARSLKRVPFDFLGAATMPFTGGGAMWQLSPLADIQNKPTCYEVTAELPGMDEKNITVKVTDGMLTIKGEKRQDKDEKGEGFYLSERRFGSIERAFRMPPGVDASKIEAVLKNGVLTVTRPKTAEAKDEKTIAVQAA